MKKIFYLICLFVTISFLTACNSTTKVNLNNPWTDCQMDLVKASKIAGFKFPLVLSNYQVRASKNIIEISYPLDEFRNVVIRKSIKPDTNDLSGNYNKYPINRDIYLPNGVPVHIRADEKKIYVTNMAASTGFYSISCTEGYTFAELESIYKVLANAEAPKR